MPRTTAFLVDRLRDAIVEAQSLIRLSETSSVFTRTNRLYVYEASYLLIFSAWEGFLEESMIRLIGGYQCGFGAITLRTGKSMQRNLALAKQALFNRRSFLLWHNPDYPIQRSQDWFANGPHETVIASVRSDIENFAAIRHYVAHRSSDCQAKFNAAALALSGATVLGDRAGRFLRKETVDPVSGMDVPWIERISGDLVRYATQIAS